MHMRHLTVLSICVALLFVMTLTLGIGCEQKNATENKTENATTEAPKTETATLVLDFGGKKDNAEYKVELTKELTAFDVLSKIANEKGFTVESSKSDFGVYIQSIDGVKEDKKTSSFWTFTVNGEMAQEAADKTKVKSNDKIEFKYSKI
ncbi:MAG: hypothetical protein ACD_63C00252G0004 [uncultured bacterium]|nr:MAG: hypothetical protein ACD_63C00252G0004 [uncultured bacterium]